MVIDYADTVSAWLLTTPTQCQRSQRLRGRVSIVNDYADTCQRSQRLQGHTVNHFTLENEKTKDKSNKK